VALSCRDPPDFYKNIRRFIGKDALLSKNFLQVA